MRRQRLAHQQHLGGVVGLQQPGGQIVADRRGFNRQKRQADAHAAGLVGLLGPKFAQPRQHVGPAALQVGQDGRHSRRYGVAQGVDLGQSPLSLLPLDQVQGGDDAAPLPQHQPGPDCGQQHQRG